MSIQEFYKLAELADRWQCSQAHIRSLIVRGDLHAIDISSTPGRYSKWLIPVESVDDFEHRRSAAALFPPLETTASHRRRPTIRAEKIVEFFK